jgi:glycosyltransferase involved in cell wall biosynthesis
VNQALSVGNGVIGQVQQMNGQGSAEGRGPDEPIATVVITTKNRKDDLRRALSSACTQSCAVEVIVVDDASSDGTSDLVRHEFPRARLVRSESSQGCIVQRNEAAKISRAPFLFSIDDDAEFSSNDVVRQTIANFVDAKIGAVAIPCIEVNRGELLHQRSPDPNRIYVTDRFVGTAYAVRKDVFLNLDGFRGFFVHQGEESDFCTRLLDSGYVVRLGTADPIKHYESPRRVLDRMDFYGRRNDVLYAWCNVPFLWLVPHLLGTTLHGVVFGIKVGRIKMMLRGLSSGYRDCFRYWWQRKPVARRSYRLFRFLRHNSAMPLEKIEDSLRAIRNSKLDQATKA